MKKIIFIFTMAFGTTAVANAQTTPVYSENEAAIKNYDGTGGHFDYALNAREHVNVNYGLTPKNPVATAHFMLHTPEPMAFWATVSDAGGKTVFTWKPENKVYLYNADWNIAALKAGNYKVNIYLDGNAKSIFQFGFTKK